MPTANQEEEARDEVKSVLDRLVAIKPEELIREDISGKALSFAPYLPLFTRFLKLATQLANCDLNDIPYQALVNLKSVATNVLNTLSRIKNYVNIADGSLTNSEREQTIDTLRGYWEAFFTHSMPILSFA